MRIHPTTSLTVKGLRAPSELKYERKPLFHFQPYEQDFLKGQDRDKDSWDRELTMATPCPTMASPTDGEATE